MTQDTLPDSCPISGASHKYFPVGNNPSTVFEPLATKLYDAQGKQLATKLYKKVEYQVMSCNCSSVVKVEVRQA